jgi:DNA-binding response OmpR family regulator
MLATILLIDYNLTDIYYVQRILIQQGYGILWARSGVEAFSILEENKVDLILSDIHLPDITGFDCAIYIKNKFQIMIAFYTDYYGNENMVNGLGIAEDYILKSCPLDEFLARIRMLLRRSKRPICQIILPPMKIDCVERIVKVDGIKIELTPTEFNIMNLLASSPNVLIPFNTINEVILGYPQKSNSQTIMVHISNIRKKIFNTTKKTIEINSVSGRGYVLAYSPFI